MEYSIKALSRLAGVSARTLRYYDETGLLAPSHVNEAGYRFYGEKELEILQQILFYRERGFDLKSIQKIIYEKDFDLMVALEEHLEELEAQKKRMDALICTVKKTILSMRGEYVMEDKEKFEAFKERIVRENEEKYGTEVREKYGDQDMDVANRKVLNMSEEEWERFQNLGSEICTRLKESVAAGIKPESEEGERITALHKEWLGKTLKNYTKEAHKGIANMYVADERFKMYYDKEMSGCAEFLEKAICYWVDRT